MIGSAADDVLFGGDGEDALRGGDGDDYLRGDGTDPDDADGESPADDEMDGGDGRDVVDYSQREEDVTVDLGAGEGGEAGERDRLTDLEQVNGGSGTNLLRGNDLLNVLVNASKGSRCGGGIDAIRPKRLRDFPYVPSDCERVEIGESAEVSRPVVLKRRRGIRMRVYPLGERIRGKVEFRVGGKVVGTARLRTSRAGRFKQHRIVARLNARGRRTSFAGKRLETRIKRPNRDTVGFAIKLKG